MNIFNTNFDDLHMMDAVYGEMRFDAHHSMIEVLSGMEFMPEHPAYAIYGTKCPKAMFIFHHVGKYVKNFAPYIESSSGLSFGPTQIESKDWSGDGVMTDFYIDGVQLYPVHGWLAVELRANSFELQIQDELSNE